MIVVDWSLQWLKEKLFILNMIRCVIENWLQYCLFLSNDLFLPDVNIGFYTQWFVFYIYWFNKKLLPSLFLLRQYHSIGSYPQSFLPCKYDFRISFHLVTDINIATRGEEELLQGGIWFSPGTNNVWGDISHSILNIGYSKGGLKTKKGLKKKNYEKY